MVDTYVTHPTDDQLWNWAKSNQSDFYTILMEKYTNPEERLKILKASYQIVLQNRRSVDSAKLRPNATFKLGTFFPIWDMVRRQEISTPQNTSEVNLSGPEPLHLILFLLILTLINMEKHGIKIQMHHPPKISDETLDEHQDLAERKRKFLFHLKTTMMFPTSSNFSACLEMATLMNEQRDLKFLWQDIFCDVPYEKIFEEHQSKIISFYRKLGKVLLAKFR